MGKLRLTNVREPELPRWLTKQYGGAHRFRALKRAQILATLKALDAVCMGCAFIPRGQELARQAQNLLMELQRACSVREWRR